MAVIRRAWLLVLPLLLSVGCSTTAGLRASSASAIVVNVFGEGFASKKELQDCVDQNFEDVNQKAPFTNFGSHPLKFVAHLLKSGTLGVTPVADILQCYFTFDTDFDKHLATEKKRFPGARETIVLIKGGNSGVGACAMSNDLIVTSEYVGADGIAHELGHALGGLKDETSGGGVFSGVQGKPHKEPNCSDDGTTPGWTLFDPQGAALTPRNGCEGYGSGLYRPSDDCRMSSPDEDFCCVCMKYMIRHLGDMLNVTLPQNDPTCTIPKIDPSSGSSGPISGVYATAQFGNGASDEITYGDAAFARPTLAAGDAFVTLVAEKNAIATVALPDPPTIARAYSPGGGVDRKVTAPLPATVTFFVPGAKPSGKIVRELFLIYDLSGTIRLDVALSRINDIITTGLPP